MLKKIILSSVLCLLFYGLAVVVSYDFLNDDLPNIDELERFRPKRVTRVYSADNKHLRNFLEENRELIDRYEDIPRSMRNALIAVEDRRFFDHWGIDLRRIAGAIKANVLSLNPIAEGASTLTQQVARSLHAKVGTQRSRDSFDDVMASYARKIREQITAVHIERLYTKHEILTMYLNAVFFGHDAYGLKSAAHLYFDKELEELSLSESALLAGLLQGPNYYSPLVNPERAAQRRNLVLRDMASFGKITWREYERLRRLPVQVRRGQRAATYGLAPYFVEYVRQDLVRGPGEDPHGPASPPALGSSLKRDGYTVVTTLDSRLQEIAEKHFTIEIGKVQERVDAHLATQDSSSGLPDSAVVQAAFVAMDPTNGHILAMIGGRDSNPSGFNRATQAHRQAGSAFKPFVYTAALENGWFTVDELRDNAISLDQVTGKSPCQVEENEGDCWEPVNYDRKFDGLLTLREGFKRSRNLIAIKLVMEIGYDRVRQYAANMGIRSPIKAVYSIGIGSSEVRLLEMVAAYSVFANKGIRVEPVAVKEITDAEGNAIYSSPIISTEVLRPSVAVLMTDMMQSVVDEPRGTGNSIRTRYGFRPAAAGKTGTTNDYADAWFIGFTPHLVVGVWVGMDDPRVGLVPRQSGAVAALPLWVRFMKEVYADVEPYSSRANETFEYPEGLLVGRLVCEDSHKLATKYCPRQAEELFIANGLLPEFCPLHGGEGEGSRRSQRF